MKKKSNAPPLSAHLSGVLSGLRRRTYRTIREYAATLIQLVRYRDGNGHDIGFDYGYIRDAVLRKFPTVPGNGPHCGKPTKMPYKELQEFACELNRCGIKLPFRPFRPRHKRSVSCPVASVKRNIQKPKKEKPRMRDITNRRRGASGTGIIA